MRLHVVALPHTRTTSDFLTCAYTQKVVKFCPMMMRQGYEVVLYGSEINDAPCDEHVVLIPEEVRSHWFGERFDTVHSGIFDWNAESAWWKLSNEMAIAQIRERIEPRDIICIIGGTAQGPIAAAYPDHLVVEWGVGYEGIFTNFRIFESYAWMHYVYGKKGIINGEYYDDVIPNFFEPGDFRLEEKEDYLLFMGRVVHRKGPHVAAEIAKAVGSRLIIAGPGAEKTESGLKSAEVLVEGDHVEYVGEVGVEDRARLMARARAVIVPTIYIEPFGGVAVEAMMSGTPVVASDWGAFVETVTPDVGFRFRTLREAVRAVESASTLVPSEIRERAISRYGTDEVGFLYDNYFTRLHDLFKAGWYEL